VFTAQAASVTTAQTVTLTATTGTTSRTLSLRLNAGAAVLTVNATSISFGSVLLNTPVTQILILTSSGTAAVTVSSIKVTGTGFSLSPIIVPFTLNPGQTATAAVLFDPTATGSMTGQLSISSNSSTNPSLTIPLSGTATASISYQVNLTWQAPASSTDPIAGYHIYRAASGTTSYSLLNSALVTQTSYADATVQSGQTYDYEVKSVDASGVESSPSNLTTVSIP
jgi:hypothetical protein